MTVKKVLCALMALVMVFALTACKSGETSKLTVKLCGVTVKAPLTLDKLGDDFTLFSFGEVSVIEFAGMQSGIILYKGEVVADAVFESSDKSNDRKKKIETLMCLSDYASEGLSVNGFFIGYTKSQALDMIGEPTEKLQLNNSSQEGWYYREDGASEDDNYLEIWFDKDGKAWDIIVDID